MFKTYQQPGRYPAGRHAILETFLYIDQNIQLSGCLDLLETAGTGTAGYREETKLETYLETENRLNINNDKTPETKKLF